MAKGLGLVFAAAITLAASVVAQAADYSGKYTTKVTNPGGATATGEAVIKKSSGSIYTIEWRINGVVEVGVCLGEETRLSCGYRLANGKQPYVGFDVYTLGENGKLLGRWADNRDLSLGKEVLTPIR